MWWSQKICVFFKPVFLPYFPEYFTERCGLLNQLQGLLFSEISEGSSLWLQIRWLSAPAYSRLRKWKAHTWPQRFHPNFWNMIWSFGWVSYFFFFFLFGFKNFLFCCVIFFFLQYSWGLLGIKKIIKCTSSRLIFVMRIFNFWNLFSGCSLNLTKENALDLFFRTSLQHSILWSKTFNSILFMKILYQ